MSKIQADGSISDELISLAVRAPLVTDADPVEFDMWSKENTGRNGGSKLPIPRILVYGEATTPSVVLDVSQDARIRDGSPESATNGPRITALTRNDKYEWLGLIKFDVENRLVGRIDSVKLAWSFRKTNRLDSLEILEYPSDWDETTVVFDNAPEQDFASLNKIGAEVFGSTPAQDVTLTSDITDYFISKVQADGSVTDGLLSLAVRAPLVTGADPVEFDMWSKENTGRNGTKLPIPQILIYGDVSTPSVVLDVAQDARIRDGSPESATNGPRITALTRNNKFEWLGLIKFDVIGKLAGEVDSVKLAWSFRKTNRLDSLEILEYPSNWDETTVNFSNAPEQDFASLNKIGSRVFSGTPAQDVTLTADITGYFNSILGSGGDIKDNIISLAVRAPLVTDADPVEFDMWSKENTGRNGSQLPIPQILIYGKDVTLESSVEESLQLSALLLNGDSLNNFSPQILSYNIEVPFAEPVPTVTATALDSSSTVEVINASSIQADSTLLIVRNQALDSVIYTLKWSEGDPNEDATLAALFIEGDTIAFFNPILTDYLVELPFGTASVPNITANPTFEKAIVKITPAATLDDTTKVVVTAQDTSISKYPYGHGCLEV